MHRSAMNEQMTLMIAGAVCCAGAASGAWAESSRSDQPVADALITTKVKTELAQDAATEATHISVTTRDGVVSLTGTVNSEAEKNKAEQDARSIDGVVSVTNNLEVIQQ